MQPILHLASISPRRSELLTQIGVVHSIIEVDVDETPHHGESPQEYVLRLAQEKALAGQAALDRTDHPLVLAADTSVVVDGRILGKPKDRGHALEMMHLLSDRSHWVYSGLALAADGVTSSLSASKVSFCQITPAQASAYWDSSEPADKAGGYGIQGLGAIFISRIEGSFSGVMGLPLFETAQLLLQAGIDPIMDR
ncbi:MAG: septum formation inhibitor Maf [Gammaproteobacteria bacterium]|nr:septum formation inhibitor Maf [Gammaproteobacteria bacterium]